MRDNDPCRIEPNRRIASGNHEGDVSIGDERSARSVKGSTHAKAALFDVVPEPAAVTLKVLIDDC
jgi:hypothetical protein